MSAEKPELPAEISETYDIRGLLEHKQAELDGVLTGLGDEIEFWNLRLADATETTVLTKPEVWQSLAQEAISSLDDQWPFMGDLLHVSGAWYTPEVLITDDMMAFPMHRQDAFNTVRSNGFQSFQEGDLPPRVGLSFVVAEGTIVRAAIQGRLTLLAYADLDDVNLIYARPGEAADTKPDLEKLHKELMLYDNLLYLHYHGGISKFFDQSAERQRQFLDMVIDRVSDSLPAPEFGETAVCEEVIIPYVYKCNGPSADAHYWERIRSSDGEPLMLTGNIEGIGILEASMVASGKPLRGEDELIDSQASICLVMRVTDGTIPDVFGGQPVYVPIRLADKIVIATL